MREITGQSELAEIVIDGHLMIWDSGRFVSIMDFIYFFIFKTL